MSSAAIAVSLNVTAVTAPAAGHLTLSPTGSFLPSTTTVAFAAGMTRAAATVMSLGEGGSLQVVPTIGGTAPVHAILDVNGYFADPALVTGVAPPAFDPPPGAYGAAPTVTLRSTTPGAAIRYTLDGSDPTPTVGIPYNGPFAVAEAPSCGPSPTSAAPRARSRTASMTCRAAASCISRIWCRSAPRASWARATPRSWCRATRPRPSCASSSRT